MESPPGETDGLFLWYNLVKEALEIIIRGEIIEEYPNDWPHPSCLVFGCTVNGRYLHAVVAVKPELLRLVTVYEPDPEIFPDLKHRKV